MQGVGEESKGVGGLVGKDRKQLTLAIRCHVWHAGILHHGCRTSSSHHRSRVISTRKGTLSSHGELLVAIHHLRLVGGWTWLHVRVLRRRGTAVESWPRASASRNGIGEAIRGRVHGRSSRAVKPKLGFG